VFTILLRITESPVLAPGALERLLANAFDHALGAKIGDVATIDDPYKALLDRIDAAIAGVDLGAVRTQVLDALHALRDAIAAADLKSIGDVLRDALAPVGGAVDELEGGVKTLLDELRAHVHDAAGAVHGLAESVGEFAPDGSFRFSVEDELHAALTSARTAISGDPNDPAAPSVAGELREFKLAIDGFLAQLTALLQPIGASVDGAATSVKGAIDEFAAFLGQLKVPALLEDLRKKVEAVVAELTPIAFSDLVDPIVAGLEENTEKIKGIDATKLNDLLREALSVALDLVIAIDFTTTIEEPLSEQFEQVKALPAQVIAGLQERYDEALGFLDALSPEKLLAGLIAAFDTLKSFEGQLDAAALLGPLDQLHDRYLRQPVARVKPSQLLKPLEEAFGTLRAAVAELDGAELLAPAQQGLSELKAAVAGLNLTGPVDDLLSELERLDAQLRALRPSKLVEPLQGELERLDAELERFRPSKVFEPVTALAAPLLDIVAAVQQEAVAALHAAFQAPLALLERLNPQSFARELQRQLDAVIAAIEGLKIPDRIAGMAGRQAQLRAKAATAGGEVRVEFALHVDVEWELAPFVAAHDRLLAALRDIKRELSLDALGASYDELHERVLGLVPAFGRELLSVEDFKRLMALASPLRFLQDLDARFDALKARLLPVSPQELAAELDAAHAEVLAQIADLGLDDRLAEIKATIERLQGIVTGLRIDFVGAELDKALADVRAVVDALDPARLLTDLDAIHAEVVDVVDDAKPSALLADLQQPLDAVKGILDAVDPRTLLLEPLNAAWEQVEGKLAEVDLETVLSPVGDRLDELEQDFFSELKRTEKAFDDMLRAAKAVLKASPASAGVSVSF
jgi:hypothetical protein